jgi:hypothetical protein
MIATLLAPESSIPATRLIKAISIEEPHQVRPTEFRVQGTEFPKQGRRQRIVKGSEMRADIAVRSFGRHVGGDSELGDPVLDHISDDFSVWVFLVVGPN